MGENFRWKISRKFEGKNWIFRGENGGENLEKLKILGKEMRGKWRKFGFFWGRKLRGK